MGSISQMLECVLAEAYNRVLGNNHREVNKSVVHIRQVKMQNVRRSETKPVHGDRLKQG